MMITNTFELTRLPVQLEAVFGGITDCTDSETRLFLVQYNNFKGVLPILPIVFPVNLRAR